MYFGECRVCECGVCVCVVFVSVVCVWCVSVVCECGVCECGLSEDVLRWSYFRVKFVLAVQRFQGNQVLFKHGNVFLEK